MATEGGDEPPLVDVERFIDLHRICKRPSTYTGEGFDASNPPCWNMLRILLVGAGGLGCEALHCLALTGFEDVHVIDMDTIDLTNLNRQFLFRDKDIGRPKADVAADFINRKCPWMRVTPHFGRIEHEGDDFYRQFHLVILGLDSIHARQWLCRKYASLRTPLVDDVTGEITWEGAVPLIDGGTEGFKGSARHIQFGKGACIDCAMYLYPPRTAVPFCTLENVPRAPEHCVLYVKEKLWGDLKPFDGSALDGDNADHIDWIAERAQARQAQFKIPGDITFRFTQGVVKNVVAAVGFTNAMIASMCVNEAFKLATGIAKPFDNYMFYDGGKGICCYTQSLWPNSECESCQLRSIKVSKRVNSRQLLDTELVSERPTLLHVGDIVNMRFLLPDPVGMVSTMLPSTHPLASSLAGVTETPIFDHLTKVSRDVGSSTWQKLSVLEISGGVLKDQSFRYLVAWSD